MAKNKKIIILLTDEKCKYCKIFKSSWEQLLMNPIIKEFYHMISFTSNGAVGGLQPGEKRYAIPRAFDNYRNLPTLLIITLEEYSKRWDLETGDVINDSLRFTETPFQGQIITHAPGGKYSVNTKGIMDWLVENK